MTGAQKPRPKQKPKKKGKKMKKTLFFVLALSLTLAAIPVSAADPGVKCRSALLTEASTGEILFEKNADERLPIASVTKIMTLLLTVEAIDGGILNRDDVVTVSEYAASMGGSQAYMEPGEKLTLHEMLKAVAVASANDGAVALAEHIAGSESAFVDKMNERARELGMKNTLFCNPTGLDDDCDPYSCARDVALMSRELLSHETILEYTTIWTDSIRGGAFGLANTNKLVRFYSGANGLKTGSTSKAKFCVSAAAKRDGMQLIAVVLGGETSAERFEDAKTLLNFGFAGYAVYDPPEPEQKEVKVWGGKTGSVVPVCPTPSLLIEKAQKNSVSSRVEIADELFAPVAKGQVIGKIVYEAGGKIVRELSVTAEDGVEKADAKFIFGELFRRVCFG